MKSKSKKSSNINFNFVLFVMFSVMGGIISYIEIVVLAEVIKTGSVETLTFEFVKLDIGTITQGYSALFQHIALLSIGVMFFALAIHSFNKIFIKSS